MSGEAEESLEKMKSQWENYMRKYSSNKQRGILGGAANWLFGPEKLDNEVSNSVSRHLRELHEDWQYLSFVLELHDLGSEIGGVIKDSNYGKKYLKNPHQLHSLLLDLRRKTDEVMEQTLMGRALELGFKDLFKECFKAHFDGSTDRLLNIIQELIQIVHLVDDGCAHTPDQQMVVLIFELTRLKKYFDKVGFLWHRIPSEDFDIAGHPFATHLASVYGKIIRGSFEFWINRNKAEIAPVKAAQLVDLGRQIDPTNSKVFNLYLSFQVAINRYETDRVSTFRYLDYLCAGFFNEYRDFREVLKFLIDFYVLNAQPSSKDLSPFAEIEAVFRDVSILGRAVHPETEAGSFRRGLADQILVKARILKMELFLKVGQLRNTSTSSMIFEDVAIVENLRDLVKDLLGLKPKKYCNERQYLIFTQEMRDEVEYVETSLQSKGQTNFLGVHSLSRIFCKIIFFMVEPFLLDLLRECGDDVRVKHQLTSLVEDLAAFKRLVVGQLLVWPNASEEEAIFIQIAQLARRITLISYSTLPGNHKELLHSLPQLSKKVEHIKALIRKITLPSTLLSGFPKTNNLGLIKFLCRNVKELLKYNPTSIAPVKFQLEQVEQQLELLESLLLKFSDFELENGDLNDYIRDTTCALEYVVESIELDDHSRFPLLLHTLLEDIPAINLQIPKVAELSDVDRSKTPPSVSREILAINEVMVDLVNVEKAVIEKLMRGSLQRDVVSIVGMPGLGKTTLARKVFDNKSVMYHFPRHAWCTVSQVYSERALLLDIISGIHGLTDEIQKMTDNELQVKVRRCLLGSRYLIILDDVWDVAVWHYLQICLPNDNNGSKILVTSRLQDVHLKIKPGSEPYVMRSFTCEESWMLLERKIFDKGVGCPEELLSLGKKIALHCQGLPLAVVAIAGLLRKTEKTADWWEQVSESLCTQVMNDPENKCKEVLELSYKHLPDEMKACFLYLGVFSEDRDIPRSKLIQFWVAEGFIQETESKNLQEVAQDYLMELINRSLVLISKKGSDGKVKSYRLHDLLRDLCLSKAKAEIFFNLVTRHDEPYASFPTSHYGMELYDKDKVEPVIFESYRLSINLRRNHFFDSRPSGPGTRSLILSASADKEPRRPYDMSVICKNFRLLRILDLECINIGVSFLDEIGLMVQLRYLAVSGYLGFIPPSIANLWKLQFLVVRAFESGISLPGTIWSMVNLRHLHVNEHVSFDLNEVGSLDNLVSFCTPSFSFGDDTINLLRRLPNLLKMKCIFLESWDSSKNCNQFPVLDVLTRLESLKIIYLGRAIASGEFILPFSLRKLTLSGFRLPWNHVSRVGLLPNLRVLKLASGAFEGPRWEMNEDEFKELEFLKLEDLNIAEWDAYSDHLPNLIQLVVRSCKNLEEIPQDFASIDTLEMIQV